MTQETPEINTGDLLGHDSGGFWWPQLTGTSWEIGVHKMAGGSLKQHGDIK